MHSNERTESIRKLLRRVRSLNSRGVRDREQSYWIEGIRNFVWAYDAGISFELIVHSPILLKSDCADMLSRRLKTSGVQRLRVSPEEFRALSQAPRASGIAAIVRQHWKTPAAIPVANDSFFLVVQEITSLGNLGTILRTAEASGCAGVFFVGPSCDPFDPAAVRASMGGIFNLPIARLSPREFLSWSSTNSIRLVGLSPSANRTWTDLPSDSPIAFLLGQERRGLSIEMQEFCNFSIRLPIVGKADSLNVSVAAGIAMYEIVRRRQMVQAQLESKK